MNREIGEALDFLLHMIRVLADGKVPSTDDMETVQEIIAKLRAS